MLVINGVELDLNHLEVIQLKMPVILHGNIEKTIPIRWFFSGHCYTRKKSEVDTLVDGEWYEDGSSHNPRPRVFCSVRYDLSKLLPTHINNIVSNDLEVCLSSYGNYFTIQASDLSTQSPASVKDYLIFMSAKKIHEPNVQKHVKVLIESAYLKSDAKNLPKANRTLLFSQMISAKWTG